MNGRMNRKDFLKICVAGLAAILFHEKFAQAIPLRENSSNARVKKHIKGDHDLAAAKGKDVYLATVKAVESLGGMGRFVAKQSVVVIKPNIGWDRTPEQAANTNPEVVAALVEMSFNAGAKRVNVFDITCNDPRRCYENSGIEKAARDKGANVYFADDWNMVKARFAYASPMEGWPVLRDALECDTFINVPVLKHHGLAGLTISMKNLMGVCGGDRGRIHQNIGAKLAVLTDFISPELTVIDASRVLLRHGPTGGSLKDVAVLDTIIAGTDPVLADAYAAKLIGIDPMSLSYMRIASKRKFGSADLKKADIIRVSV